MDAFDARTALLLAITALTCVLLVRLHVSHRRRVKAARAAVFDDCLDALSGTLSNYRVVQDDVDYPVLTGEYRSRAIELKPIADHVGYRKVPSLWLQVSLFAELPSVGVLDYLVRPQNIEFFSPSASLPVELPIPAHWPRHAALKCDRPEALPPLEILDPVLELFEEVEMKELLITPRGVRLVRQLDQAVRREYLVMRAVQFEHDRIDPALLRRLLDALVPLADALQRLPATAPSAADTAPITGTTPTTDTVPTTVTTATTETSRLATS